MKNTALLRRKILARKASVGVLGQGYVGVPLACAAAEAGFNVTGIDTDQVRVQNLHRGLLTVPGVNELTFRGGLATGHISFTTDLEPLGQSEVILICLPTPVRDHTPDLSYVEGACRDVARHLTRGQLVILESSTYPGTTS